MRAILAMFWMCAVYGADKPSPPDEFPPEKGPPKDYNNCRINANTLFPWIVAVVDLDSNLIVGHGSMLTYIAFIGSCRQYSKPPSKYLSRGQFLWNLTRPLDPCKQDRKVEQLFKHPKCDESPQMATFFDFTVFRMKDPFAITGPSYPTMAFPNSPADMLTEVHFINIVPNTTGCIIPSFLLSTETLPTFDWDSFVMSIPFHSKCLKLLCEKEPKDGGFSEMCEARFGKRANGTQLCMRYMNTTKPFKVENNIFWSAGTPLVCNSTAYGITAQVKIRSDFSFHYVITFLRVWEWLIEMLLKHTAPWGHNGKIEDKDLVFRHFDEPKRVSILDQTPKPRPVPENDSVSTTSFFSTSFLILLSLFM
ncbi:hypothetical protein GE061_013084 [Apolygus lucorum]|uniref:Peptidase S1 domain-containing protein n=1 Tax=Apolygus lucorum TaxID=248454 RepID=A0A6A4K1W4_APOLU|nr:hypothetical protein GE061_013084 [Apolygus lucorum]